MSILSDKSDIFENVAILKTTADLYLNQNSTSYGTFGSSSSLNNKDPFLFIIDILKVLAGSNSIQTIITQIFSFLPKLENNFKVKLKSEFAALNGNKNNLLSNDIKNGLSININKIDFYGDLFTTDNTYLDDYKQNLISSMKSPNSIVNLGNGLYSQYNSSNGNFIITPINVNQNQIDFINNIIDSTNFINTQTLLATTMDIIFNASNKSKDEISLNDKLDKILNKFITNSDTDDSYFSFNVDELIDNDKKTIQSNNLNTNVGSKIIVSSLNSNDINNIVSNVTFPISKNTISNTLNSALSTIINNNTIDQNDTQSVSNDFLNQLTIGLKTNILRNFILSPQLNIIYTLNQSLITNNTFDPIGDLSQRKNLSQCVTNQIINDLIESIFELIKKELLVIVGTVADIYIKESITKYTNILKSLI